MNDFSRGIKKLPDGRIEIRVRGVDPRTGKRKEVRRIVKKVSPKKAQRQQERWRIELEEGTTEPAQRVTLTAYAQSWLRSKKVAGYRHASLAMRAQFPSRGGGYREPSSIRRSLDFICEQAKLDRHVTPHWMRHTYNNLLRKAQVDRIVLRATTGHSSEEMTEHYSEVGLEEKKEAAAKVLKLVGMEGV